MKYISLLCVFSVLFNNVAIASERWHALSRNEDVTTWQVERLPEKQTYTVLQNGLQVTTALQKDGIVQFEKLKPGHYSMFSQTKDANIQFAFTVSSTRPQKKAYLATTLGCQTVRLQNGTVQGRIVTRTFLQEGKLKRIPGNVMPIPCQCSVRLLQGKNVLPTVQSDAQGWFTIPRCKAGQYTLQAGGEMGYLEYPIEVCENAECLPFEGCLMDPVDSTICRKAIETNQPVANCACAGGIAGGAFGSGGGGGGAGGGMGIGGFLGGALAALLGAGLLNNSEAEKYNKFWGNGNPLPASPDR
jgi:hypothetical protein